MYALHFVSVYHDHDAIPSTHCVYISSILRMCVYISSSVVAYAVRHDNHNIFVKPSGRRTMYIRTIYNTYEYVYIFDCWSNNIACHREFCLSGAMRLMMMPVGDIAMLHIHASHQRIVERRFGGGEVDGWRYTLRESRV